VETVWKKWFEFCVGGEYNAMPMWVQYLSTSVSQAEHREREGEEQIKLCANIKKYIFILNHDFYSLKNSLN